MEGIGVQAPRGGVVAISADDFRGVAAISAGDFTGVAAISAGAGAGDSFPFPACMAAPDRDLNSY